MLKNVHHFLPAHAKTSLKRLASTKVSSPPDASVHFVLHGASEGSSTAVQKLWSTACTSGSPKALDTRLLFSENSLTSIVSIGDASSWGKMPSTARRETVRKAAGSAVGRIRDVAISSGVRKIRLEDVDDVMDVHAAAVGAKLGLHSFSLKTDKNANPGKDMTVSFSNERKMEEWNRGTLYAEAQILARELTELPANMLTPTLFCERIKKESEGLNNIELIVRDEAWARDHGMQSFLSVTKGTAEPAKLLEIHYKGAGSDDQPLAFVGKGVTFDSGGISLKPGSGMKLMRGDMGGAASVCAAILGIARLRLPINMVAVVPLCENMPGPAASKPGDIIRAMNGKTIEIDNTDAEGRLILADALYYASTKFNPHTIIDVATLTGAMSIALGGVYSGVFSSSDDLWDELRVSGAHEHDRFWRMPLDDEYSSQITGSNADLCNVGGRSGGSCTAALFLKSFVDGIDEKNGIADKCRWAHIDIAGSMEADKPSPYQYRGMTGRPTRALIEFARRSSEKRRDE